MIACWHGEEEPVDHANNTIRRREWQKMDQSLLQVSCTLPALLSSRLELLSRSFRPYAKVDRDTEEEELIVLQALSCRLRISWPDGTDGGFTGANLETLRPADPRASLATHAGVRFRLWHQLPLLCQS